MKAYINEEEEDVVYITMDKPEWSGLELKEVPDDLYERYEKCDREFYEIQKLLRDEYL